jgi:hypothetical protein
MSFYTFALDELHPLNPRSRGPNDILFLSFGVVVNKRDQGYYILTAPIFPERLRSSDIDAAAANNGYPSPKHANTRSPWTIGPIEVADNDEVAIIYEGINVSDDPNFARSDAFAQAETKLASYFYAYLLGNFWSGLGLAGVPSVVDKFDLPDEVKKFLDNPVGYLLGVHPSGPCNCLVFKDALKFTGRELGAFAYEPQPVREDIRKYLGTPGRARSTRRYTDEETHNTDICGLVAHTEVSIAIVKYAFYSLSWWGPKNGKLHPGGLRKYGPSGAQEVSIKDIFGLKN